MALKKIYICKICQKIVNKRLVQKEKHLREFHPLELAKANLPIAKACEHFYNVITKEDATRPIAKPTKFKCKLCDNVILSSSDKEKHLEDYHKKDLIQLHIPIKLACEHLFEPITYNAVGDIEKPNHYRCKLCKEILEKSLDKQRLHYELKHATLLDKNGMSSLIAAKIYREPITIAEKEIPNPRNVFSQFHTPRHDAKGIHSSKISFVAKLINGFRGRRASEEHLCQCCGINSKEPWVYTIDGYEPIYLCSSCHRRIKCGNFVPNRIIYSGFETGRKKH